MHRIRVAAGLICPEKIRVIRCDLPMVKERIREPALDRGSLADLGERSRAFVRKHHFLEVVCAIFAGIQRSPGIRARGEARP